MSDYVGKPIGVENATWFPWEYDDTAKTWGYGNPVKLARLITVDMNPQMAEALLESDNAIEDDVSLMTAMELVINASQLTDAIRGALLGHTVDGDGGMLVKSTDVAQKGAFAFKVLLSKQDGEDKYKYFIFYMGKFKEFSEKFETLRRGGLTFQTHDGLTGTFSPRESDGAVYYALRSDEAVDDAAEKITGWFEVPQETGTTEPTAAGGA